MNEVHEAMRMHYQWLLKRKEEFTDGDEETAGMYQTRIEQLKDDALMAGLSVSFLTQEEN